MLIRPKSLPRAAFAALLLLSSGTLLAQEMKVEDLKAEIVPNCILAVGEWGTDMVQLCVDREVAALEAVLQYRTQARASVARCTERWKRSGWVEVKACVEHDIESQAALATYASQHQALLEQCKAKVGAQGPAAVKDCVDEQLTSVPSKP